MMALTFGLSLSIQSRYAFITSTQDSCLSRIARDSASALSSTMSDGPSFMCVLPLSGKQPYQARTIVRARSRVAALLPHVGTAPIKADDAPGSTGNTRASHAGNEFGHHDRNRDVRGHR